MKVLIVGRGGREYSLMMHLAKSDQVSKLFAAPGNGGMEQMGTCVAINEMDIEGLIRFAKNEQIDLTIVGPEAPLNIGIANRFQEEGLAIFAPTKEAALLEGSKKFAKKFMQTHDIPTANYATFTKVDEAKAYIQEQGTPIVIKADGLAEGKGVVVAMSKEEAFEAVNAMLIDREFDKAGATIVIEEFLEGEEFSLMAFVNGENVYPMITARDHKRAYDNDEGPNTGGMGAYAPVPDVTEEHLTYTVKHILEVAAKKLVKTGRSFTGILYAGLIMTEDGPKVIEFNTRFGDPEIQVVLPLLKNDLAQVFVDVLAGKDPTLQWKDQACTGIVLASKGYPGTYQTGALIPAFSTGNNTFIVHAGTKKEADNFISNGGRVLLIGSVNDSVKEAAKAAYSQLSIVEENPAFFYRKDIGLI